MCDSSPALLPQTTTRLENSTAVICNGTAVVLFAPRGGVTAVPLASSIVKPYSVQSAGVGFLCAVLAQTTGAGTSLVHSVELKG